MRPTLRILELQVTSSQMSVDQSRLPTAHTTQNTLRRNGGGGYQFGVKSHPTVLFKKLFYTYQVELLYGLIHCPFLAAGANS